MQKQDDQIAEQFLDLVELFCCPTCEGNLQAFSSGLDCLDCGTRWPIQAGIPCFLHEGQISNYGLAPHMKELNESASRNGWRTAAVEWTQLKSRPDYALEYMTSEARADFRFILPVNDASVILDIGSGWGNISTAFARVCRHVYALDTTLENLRFIQIRAQQENLPNVIPVMGDAAGLPVPPETCDLAIMSGVLEWVAWGRSDGSPGVLQQQALENVWKTLKPGGYLYIGIENRFGFKYFLGAREPHTQLRFISLLPRSIGDLYSRIVRRQPYREWIYSKSGLKVLLRRTGFDQVDFWYPIPGYQNFRFLVPHIDDFILQRLRAHPSFSKIHYLTGKMGLKLGLQHWASPCFSVIARKPHD